MAEERVPKQPGKDSESKLSLSRHTKTIVSSDGQRLFGPGFRSGSSLITTESQLRRSHNSGIIKGVIITTAAIATGAFLFWLGMNRSEGIIKKMDAEIKTKDAKITLLEGQSKTERNKIRELLEGMMQKNGAMKEAKKKNKWNAFYNEWRDLENAANGALQQYQQEPVGQNSSK